MNESTKENSPDPMQTIHMLVWMLHKMHEPKLYSPDDGGDGDQERGCMTDQQLKALFPKLLPGRVIYYTNPSTKVSTLFWNNSDPSFVKAVQDNQLLSLCREVEETFTPDEQVRYAEKNWKQKDQKTQAQWYQILFQQSHASWQARIQAAAEVGGVV